MKIRLFLTMVVLSAVALAAAACSGGRATGGASIQGSGSTIDALSAEGLFQAGENEAAVKSKIAANNMTYKAVEASEYHGGTVRRIITTSQKDQPFVVYIFLPSSTAPQGVTVVVNRQKDIVEAVLPWDCFAVQTFLKNAGVTDFENDTCKASIVS